VRRLASAGEEDHGYSGATPIEHFQRDVLLYGYKPGSR